MTLSLLPRTFERTIGDTSYSLGAVPVWMALVAALGSCVALLLLLLAARRRPGAMVSPFLPALAVPFVGFPVFVYITRNSVWDGKDVRTAAVLFHDVMLLDAASAAFGIGAAVAATLVVVFRTQHQLRLLPYAVPCMLIGVLVTSAAQHASAIYEVGELPFYEVRGPHDMHVGHERSVPLLLMRAPHSRWILGMEGGPQLVDEPTRAAWDGLSAVSVRGTASGKVSFGATAQRGPVALTTTLAVNAIPETASPLLSLRVGDRFVYRVRATSSTGRFLYFISFAGTEQVHEVVVEVTGTRERDGFRTFLIQIRSEDALHEIEVVALAGETRLYSAETGTIGAPIISLTSDASRPDPVSCSFALLDAGEALCQRGGRDVDVPAPPPEAVASAHAASRAPAAPGKTKNELGHPPVAFSAAAPSTFTRGTPPTGVTGSLTTLFVAVVTLGLVVLPDGSSISSYALVSTHRGPAGAAEAPPG